MFRRRYLAMLGTTAIAGCSSVPPGSQVQTPTGTTYHEWPSPSPTPDATGRQRLPAGNTVVTSSPARSSPSPSGTTANEPEGYHYREPESGVTEAFPILGGFTVFWFSHSDEQRFEARLVENDAGGTREVLAAGLGEWSGRIATYVPSGEYRVEFDGGHVPFLHVKQPRPIRADLVDLPHTETDGPYDASYFGPFAFPGRVDVASTAEGNSTVIVAALDLRGRRIERLVNDVGPIDTESTFTADGYGWISVTASGEWTISIAEG